MNPSAFLTRLAVCSWSLQPASPADLIAGLRATGLTHTQLDLDPLREDPATWADLPALLAEAGITAVSGMFRTAGEDYSTLDSIRTTGGLVPDATWPTNWHNLQTTVANARRLNLKQVMTHVGFLPHDPTDSTFDKMIDRLRQVARLFADHGLTLCCETGQEPASALLAFLRHLNEPNVAVNFDPANMLLYASGDPIDALRALGPLVQSCHLKDAIQTTIPGTWGDDVPIGTGQVDWPAFFTTMAAIPFPGFFCIEREAGTSRLTDITCGLAFVRRLLENA